MKIAVIGNCQARPVAQYLKTMCEDIELLPETIVHLSGPASADDDLQRLDQADLLLAQAVQDGYPAGHLTTNALRTRYASKVIVWPNLFFNGNCADLCYLTTTDNQRLQGPLGVYHNRLIFDCWQSGMQEEQAIDSIDQIYENHANELTASVAASLAELKLRDDSSDVQIVQHIDSQWQNKRLFFTFNHPTAELLIELSRQLADAASLTRRTDINPADENEPLDPIVPGTCVSMARILGLNYPTADTSKGVRFDVAEQGVTLSGTEHYTLPDLVRQSYAAYQAQPTAREGVRYTPNYGIPVS